MTTMSKLLLTVVRKQNELTGDRDMRQPDKYSADTVKGWPNATKLKDGRWAPARPYGHRAFSWKWRWRRAFDVLTGKADALYWDADDN